MGTRSILKTFLKNLGNSRRILPVKLAPPLLEIFDKKFETKQNDFTPRSILDIYKIDESKKWVVAVRETQRKQFLRKRFADSVTKLFKNWGVRHYSNIKTPPSVQAFYKTDEKKSCIVKNDGNFIVGDKTLHRKFLPVTGLSSSFTEAKKKFVFTKEHKIKKGCTTFPVSKTILKNNKHFYLNPNISKTRKINFNKHKNEVKTKNIVENKPVFLKNIESIPEYVTKIK